MYQELELLKNNVSKRFTVLKGHFKEFYNLISVKQTKEVQNLDKDFQ